MKATFIPETIKVGILIPTYSRLEYLKEALRSAQEQNHENLSILVADDGPGDSIGDFMRQVADPRVSYVKNSRNLKICGNINNGIRLLDPDVSWCTILCDDDLLAEDFVARCLDGVAASGATHIIDSRRIFINHKGDVIRLVEPAPPEETAAGYIRERSTCSRETRLTGIFFSRRGFEEIGGYPMFRTGFLADDAFIYALSLRDRLVYRDDATVFARNHPDAESTTYTSALASDIIATMGQFRDYILDAKPETDRPGVETDEGFKKIVYSYGVMTASNYWIHAFHGAIHGKYPGWKDDILHLGKLAESNKDLLSLYVRVRAWIALRLPLYPETSVFCRSIWRFIRRLYKSVSKSMRQ